MKLGQFVADMQHMLRAKAAEKGYDDGSADGGTLVMDFICDSFGLGHALGEIVAKAVRYSKRRDYEDLVKIAAWAFLLASRQRKLEGRIGLEEVVDVVQPGPTSLASLVPKIERI